MKCNKIGGIGAWSNVITFSSRPIFQKVILSRQNMRHKKYHQSKGELRENRWEWEKIKYELSEN